MAKRPKREQSAPGELIPIEMLCVPAEGFLVVRFLDDWRGILTHWGKKRPIACPGPDNCPTAIHRGRSIWKAYAPGEYWRDQPFEDWCPAVVELTERCVEQMQAHVLRGEVWKLQRQIGRNGTKEVAAECVDEINADRLRKPFGVEPVVWRVFGTRDIAFDVEPYLPARDFVVASAGDRPKICPKPTSKKEGTSGPLPSFRKAFEAKAREGKSETGNSEEGRPSLPPSRPGLPTPSTNGKH